MYLRKRWFVLSAMLGLFSAPQAFAQTLEQAIDGAFKGKESGTVRVGNRHGFVIKPVTVQRTDTGVKAEGYFRHVIQGKDDKVFYLIECEKGQPFKAEMVRIEYGGLFGNSGKVAVGVAWLSKKAGAVPRTIGGVVGGKWGAKIAGVGPDVAGRALNLVLKGLNAAQRRLIGNWEPSAVQLIDLMGQRLEKELQ